MLGNLSREDRALAVVACALSGRHSRDLCAFLDESRAAALAGALEEMLALPVHERAAALAREAARLSSPARVDLAAVHPERRARLRDVGSAAERSLRAGLLGEGTPARRPHVAALRIAQAEIDAVLAPLPWPDEVAAAPAPVRALLRASGERLLVVAKALGPARLGAALAASPPAVAAWLRQRLPPEIDGDLGRAPAADAAAALEALAQLTRSEVIR